MAIVPCSVDGCTAPSRTRGWCGPHYQRWRRTGSETGGGPSIIGRHATADERLRNIGWTVKPSGCWEWKGATGPRGYGKLSYRGATVPAHRLSYEAYVGPIPEGAYILHGCDNPPCMNPAHLQPGDHTENMEQMTDRNRSTTGETDGMAKLTDAQVAEIRERYAAGGISTRALGLEFGVSQQHVSALTNYRFRAKPTNRDRLAG